MVRRVNLRRRPTVLALLLAVLLGTASRAAAQVVGVYTDLPLNTPINLTAAGTTDWASSASPPACITCVSCR